MSRNNSGYLLQEALLSILITTFLVSLTYMAFKKAIEVNESIQSHQAYIQQGIEYDLGIKKECILCEEETDSQ